MQIAQYGRLSLLCLGLSLLCFFTAVVLFFVLDIRTAFADLRGHPAGKMRKRPGKESFFVPEREIMMIHTEREQTRTNKNNREEKGSL